MSFASWLRSRKSRYPFSTARRRAKLPLRLEQLEDRTVPYTVTWVGGNGDWDVASNWRLRTTIASSATRWRSR
jgi:hypothetical protein